MVILILAITLVVSIIFNVLLLIHNVGEIYIDITDSNTDMYVKVSNINKITSIPNKTFAVFRVIKTREENNSSNERR